MSTQDKHCLILGRGAMGQMFEGLLGDRIQIESWDRDPKTGIETAPLEEQLAGKDVLILAVPARPHDELLRRVASAMPDGLLCLSIAKGLDEEGQTPAQRFQSHLGADADRIAEWGLIYGPMIARDLSAGRSGFGLAAGVGGEAVERMLALFAGTTLHLQASNDIHGAAWSAILKNVYVPLIAMADGYGLGDNVRGYLLTATLAELARIIEAQGGAAKTAYSLAGLGDLITTATSESSHHRQLGEALARGDRSLLAAEGDYIRSEGAHTAAMVIKHRLLDLSAYPLFALAHALMQDPSDGEAKILDCLGTSHGR